MHAVFRRFAGFALCALLAAACKGNSSGDDAQGGGPLGNCGVEGAGVCDVGGGGPFDDFWVERIASGLSRPVYATTPVGDVNRLFVVEQYTGRIRIINLADNSINATPFLEINGLPTNSERGLLGLAFHPQYAINGFFYVYYTASNGDSIVEEFARSAGDPDLADIGSRRLVLQLTQPQANHNGGWIGFDASDGYLYIALGDGGGSNDRDLHTPGIGNAQDITDNLLGKILRIDVDGADAYPVDDDRNYAIPPDNPFVNAPGDDEIWVYGLRNPFRASFDRMTGDLYIGDVGQNQREEVNFQSADSSGGENYGWRPREGTIATPTGGVGAECPEDALDPIFESDHDDGPFARRVVTGGYVYRGPIASLAGLYIFADYQSGGAVWSLRFDGDGCTQLRNWTGNAAIDPNAGTIGNISSFAEDAMGNLYIVDLGGEIFRFSSAIAP